MSFASAAVIAAISGLVTGGLSTRVRSGPGSSVGGSALIGALVATAAFGAFTIPGFVVGGMLFSGPPSPTIALVCTLLGEAVWLVFAAADRLLGHHRDSK